MSRNSTSSNVLLAVILVLTFPIWFAVGAALLGVAVGLVGAAVGIVAAIFGVIIAIITIPFKIFFKILGWSGDWGWHDWDLDLGFGHNHWLLFIALIIIAALIVKHKKSA